jgi:hypothetical protein
VPSFAGESATAKVYTLTESGGVWTLRFGDGINGAIPPKDDQISIFYSAPGAISGQVFQIEQDPTIATKYWASFGDSCRTESGGVATSDDSGATWTVVRSDPDAGRVGLGVGADGKTAYASRAKCNGALLDIEKTTTGGGIGTWKATAVKPPNYFHFTSNDENGQGNYDNVVAVDPTDANRAAFGGITILTTSDGGGKFTDAGRVNDNPSGAIHPDFHALAFTGAKTFYAGEDGGLYSTTDMGGTGQPADWTNLNGGADPTKRLAITQFYSGAALTSTNLLGGTQDNGSVYPNGGTSALPTMTDITSSDGFFTAIDPTVDPTNPTAVTLYTEYPFMGIRRLTGTPPNFTDTRISPCGGGGGGSAGRCVAGEINDPVAFGAPFVKDPLDPQNLTGTTTAGSAQVTNVSSLVGLRVGESFSGEGIPANTTILFVGTNWAPSRAFALGQTIVGGGHTQKVTTAGTSGTTQPTWNTSGGTTDDGTVVWTDEGPTSAKVLRLSNQATAPGSSFTAGGGRLLAGSARVWETTNARSSAPTWKAISPALTKTTTGTLSFIALPPTGGNTIFTTSNDGAVFRTTDGTTWTDITGNLPGLSNSFTNPARKPFFTSVAFNPTNSAEAWVTAGVLGVGRVYHTLNADQGANTTWVDQTGTGGGVLPDAPVLSVVQKPGTDTIDLGTYYGVWECTQCAGKNTAVAWHRLGTKLPINVDVDKLTVSNDKKSLVAWTFGRGIWTLPLS